MKRKQASVAVPFVDIKESLSIDELVKECLDFCASHSILMGIGSSAGQVRVAPLCLLPSPLPRAALDQCTDLNQELHLIKRRMVADPSFLSDTLQAAAKVDEFTRRLLSLHQLTQQQGVKQPLHLNLTRTDYMLHGPTSQPQMVEMNMISAAYANLGCFIADWHRFAVERVAPLSTVYDLDKLKENQAGHHFAHALAQAHNAYLGQREKKKKNEQGVVVLVVVQPGEKNAFDQRWFDYRLWKDHGVRMVRKSLREVAEQAELDSQSAVLRLKEAQLEVSVAYFRAGYTPNDYPTELEWSGRELIEKSAAIKCPTVGNQLSGLKKVQQAMAAPGVLERFATSAQAATAVRSVFAQLWPLGPGDDEIREKAIANDCEDYVLKPQREGGGNNLYRLDAKKALETLSEEDRQGFILMSRIRPPAHEVLFLRDGEVTQQQGVSEFGVFGAFLAPNDPEQKAIVNNAAGYLLRTKLATQDDGGVSAGVAVLDSPYLI